MTSCRIRSLEPGDTPAVGALLDDAVGAGFHDLGVADRRLSFVALNGGRIVGAVAATVVAYGELRSFFAGTSLGGLPIEPPPATLAHVRELAVTADARREGVATRLLVAAEVAGREIGAEAALVLAWLPSTLAEPPSVPFYEANGYERLGLLEGFYGPGSVATDASCPYCGDPPCRCSAAVMGKDLR